MKIFQDIFSSEELLSDARKIEAKFEEVVGEVQARMVVKKDADVDIGRGNAFGGTEQQEEGGSGSTPVEKVVDLVDDFQYQETSFDLNGFKAYFKEYMKKLLTWLEENKKDRVQPFKKGGKEFFKWAIENFAQLSFYTGPSYNMENMIVMSYYKNEQDEAPTFIYIMDGFKYIKV